MPIRPRPSGRYTPPARNRCDSCNTPLYGDRGVRVDHGCGHTELLCLPCWQFVAELEAITPEELLAWADELRRPPGDR